MRRNMESPFYFVMDGRRAEFGINRPGPTTKKIDGPARASGSGSLWRGAAGINCGGATQFQNV